MLPEVQKTHYDYNIDGASPTCGDVERVVNKDEKGQEVISFVGVDYKLLEKSRPTVEYYDLQSMIKAGININVPIHTGINSRIEGADAVENMASKIFNELDKEKTE